jgi:hypothetical protein
MFEVKKQLNNKKTFGDLLKLYIDMTAWNVFPEAACINDLPKDMRSDSGGTWLRSMPLILLALPDVM